MLAHFALVFGPGCFAEAGKTVRARIAVGAGEEEADDTTDEDIDAIGVMSGLTFSTSGSNDDADTLREAFWSSIGAKAAPWNRAGINTHRTSADMSILARGNGTLAFFMRIFVLLPIHDVCTFLFSFVSRDMR